MGIIGQLVAALGGGAVRVIDLTQKHLRSNCRLSSASAPVSPAAK
jgi:hypothetical protein